MPLGLLTIPSRGTVARAGTFVFTGTVNVSSASQMIWSCAITLGGGTLGNSVATTGSATGAFTTETLTATAAWTLSSPADISLTCNRLQLDGTASSSHKLNGAILYAVQTTNLVGDYG